jgi:hypothetical protein
MEKSSTGDDMFAVAWSTRSPGLDDILVSRDDDGLHLTYNELNWTYTGDELR